MEVAQELRKELLETPNTFSSWPPPEQELLSRETEIPKLTVCLLEGILTKKPTKSAKVTRLVSSIGQDLIYHTNNGRKKTSKHVTFPFSIKRKTGSKIVINWANKFGHGISYDDVLILETYLAMEHSKDQLHRSFSPAIIQPSQFVTFVWDNNDIKLVCIALTALLSSHQVWFRVYLSLLPPTPQCFYNRARNKESKSSDLYHWKCLRTYRSTRKAQ